ncbi:MULTISPECIES: thiamine-phosphate kinase [Gammaproteobacteria]|uniref:Thiamine-monophosphate kinase n=1 Tax=Xanthomonas boreopolis TaxID=86183 RepID=A0A919KI54_9XANT|nr:thiamine-phosphate kinase [Pseudomonas sp. Hp2]GHH55338.1 thiamine-monophosphate kinase [[Pseudomonas] boreopolis]
MHEFALIDHLRARSRGRGDIALGIGDDAALLRVPPGEELVVTMDTLNDGVHFPPESAPFDIGWKTLAVNLSDLAAMGAQPAWCTLSLSLPQVDARWLDGFAEGFFALADRHGVALIGGDTTRGPLSLSVTAMGRVAAGSALRRDAARAGDDIWVTGSLGDAAAALRLWQAGTLAVAGAADAAIEPLRQRLQRPAPRVQAGLRLVGLAHAAIDVSDGLLADLGHVCARSRVGAQVYLEALPASAALRAAFEGDERYALQCAGGDDYELCFTAPRQHRDAVEQAMLFADVPVARVGRIVEGEGVVVLDPAGRAWVPPRTGYQHFAG